MAGGAPTGANRGAIGRDTTPLRGGTRAPATSPDTTALVADGVENGEMGSVPAPCNQTGAVLSHSPVSCRQKQRQPADSR